MYLYQKSKSGRYADETKKINQDAAGLLENESYVILTLGDGVSSKENSKQASKFITEFMLRYLSKYADEIMKMDVEKLKYVIISQLNSKLLEFAQSKGICSSTMASTLCFVLIDKETNEMLCLSIGDSSIVALKDDKIVFKMLECDFINSTTVTTLTKNVQYETRVRRCGLDDFSRILLMSDGLYVSLIENDNSDDIGFEEFLALPLNEIDKYIQENDFEDDASLVILEGIKAGGYYGY